MSEVRVISVKLPEEVYQEMVIRIPEGERSSFIREAISEKLQKTPKPDKLLALEERMNQIEQEFGNIRKTLADLEILTYGQNKTNPYKFATDDLDHKLIEYMLHYKGATTPQLAEYTQTNRFIILNRLRKIQETSKKQCGKPIIDYYAGERSGKKKAWWINEELIEEQTQ
jgi:Arc/MetJ-type ribon-helix-helix transcriptional regulator